MDAADGVIAVAHYCEGAGHASRMLAVAGALEDAGYETTMAGGGPGQVFVERNGYEEHDPQQVDFVEAFQRGRLWDVLSGSFPDAAARVREYVRWLRDEGPLFLVADDITAAIAATLSGTPYYYLTHDPADFYTTAVERVGALVRNRFAVRTAELFALPKVWEGEPTIPGTAVVPPIAPESDDAGTGAAAPSVDVLVVPSAFTIDETRLVAALERRGRSATLVGGEEWTVEPSLQPYVEAANAVVCSGYSTVMEAAVAGTPCVVLPVTSEQRGVVCALSETRGFDAASTVAEVVDALDRVGTPERRPNGRRAFADAVLDHAAGRFPGIASPGAGSAG